MILKFFEDSIITNFPHRKKYKNYIYIILIEPILKSNKGLHDGIAEFIEK